MIPALSVLSGVLFVLSFPKFGHPALGWVALAPLVLAVSRTRRVSGWTGAFAAGWLAGVVYFGGCVYWVAGVMQQFGGLPTAVAVAIAALLVVYLALYPALFAAVLGRAVHRLGPSAVWSAPPIWVATEWLRGVMLTGFPWVPLGSSQATVVPVVQTASVVGVSGLSFLLTLVGTTVAAAAISPGKRTVRATMAVALLIVCVMVGGTWRVMRGTLTSSGTPLRVGLVQGNIALDQKYDPAWAGTIMERYLDLSRQTIAQGAELVVWPEASTPFYLESDGRRAEPIRRLAARTATPFLIGTDEYVPAGEGYSERFFNGVTLIGSDGRSRAGYRKMFLVPFGEYVPLQDLLFFVKPLVEAVSNFSAGDEAVVFDIGHGRVSVAICYESIFPSLSRAFVAGGSELLATITNDAWFGWSSAAYQHFDQGAIRAVEQGRYVVRAANTGISGAVDPYGRLLTRTALFEPAAVTVDVRLLNARTIYSRIGDAAIWASVAISLWVLLLTRSRTPLPRRSAVSESTP